jgi:methionine aminotransferase
MSKLQILARVFYRNVKMAAEHDAINLAGIPNFPVDTVLTDIVIRLAKIMFINTFPWRAILLYCQT